MLKCLRILAVIVLCSGSFSAQAKLVDLTKWTQVGKKANGVWAISSDKHSVYQSINGAPTAFMSTESYEFRTFRGDITVKASGDDDYIGFIVSYSNNSFLLFDWKGGDANPPAKKGFSLIHVKGSLDSINSLGFTMHESNTANTTILARDHSVGWKLNQTYAFEVQVFSGRVVAKVDGKVIFDVNTPHATKGRFGFFNWSQSDVKYDAIEELFQPIVKALSANVSQGEVYRFNGEWTDENKYETHTCKIGTKPKLGTAKVVAPCFIDYTPFPDKNGLDSFSYIVRDSEGLESDAAITTKIVPLGVNVEFPEYVEAGGQTKIGLKKLGSFSDDMPWPDIQLNGAPEWMAVNKDDLSIVIEPKVSDLGLISGITLTTSNALGKQSVLGPFDVQVIPKDNLLRSKQDFLMPPSNAILKTAQDEYFTTIVVPPLKSGENNLVHGVHLLEVSISPDSHTTIEIGGTKISAGEKKNIPVELLVTGTRIPMKVVSSDIGKTSYTLKFPWLDSPDDLRYVKQSACGANDSVNCGRYIEMDRYTVKDAKVLVLIRKAETATYHSFRLNSEAEVTATNLPALVNQLKAGDVIAVNVNGQDSDSRKILTALKIGEVSNQLGGIPVGGSAAINLVVGSEVLNLKIDAGNRWGVNQISWVELPK